MNDRKTFVCEFCGAEYTAAVYSFVDGQDRLEEGQYAKSHKSPGDCIKVLKAMIDDIGSRRIV